MIKKMWGILVAVLCAVQLSAQQADSKPKYSFVVWFHDGGKVSLSLDERPVVTYSGDNIVVSTTYNRVEYAHTEVRKFTIEEVEQFPDVPAPETEPTPDPTPEFYFVVWLHSDARISFPLAEHPVLTYSDGDIVVTTSQEQLIYAHNEVRKFTISDEDISQGGEVSEIATAEHSAQWNHQEDVISFSNCTSIKNVAVYNVTGQLVIQYNISPDGTLQIPLHQFDEGTYIIKTQSITYKFIKK